MVDSSSFFSGFLPDANNDYFTTESVIEEIRGKRMKSEIEMRSTFLHIMEPNPDNILMVKNMAKKTGDIEQLSETDVEVIALASQISASILTNDLAIQNVCREMKIDYESYKSKKIKNEIIWKYKCGGCGKVYDKNYKECPHCGNNLKKFPVKIKVIR
ncbi:MAG: NOB1 family endonuclease [Thermoplasmata archaeon]